MPSRCNVGQNAKLRIEPGRGLTHCPSVTYHDSYPKPAFRFGSCLRRSSGTTRRRRPVVGAATDEIEPMYCQSCTGRLSAEAGPKPREGGAGADRFGNVQCQRCGVPLPAGAPEGTVGRKLMQLARFGLADAGEGPGRA